ncbi:general stress protein [Bacillus sp. SG-1]|uniref:general stress protein n=1 Tax=Bacillus sp. SG-1 TaxID=161544 RepID=UPI00015452C4|nr:general stress protein [Bacillus sp. SG-1]EDL63685.1 hypothetical protein BSG1_20885 [Bacillus sp. SG-1]
MYEVHTVENGVHATKVIEELNRSGYEKDDIYIFAHDKERSKDLTEGTHTESVGMSEQGMFDSLGNTFKKRGDELRSKMSSLGLSDSEADRYEEELDKGKVVVIGSKEH